MYRRVVTLKLTDVSKVRIASIIGAMIMETIRTSETSVNLNVTTRRYIPEDSKLQIRNCPHQVFLKLYSAEPSGTVLSDQGFC
jgi:hypothetical protein